MKSRVDRRFETEARDFSLVFTCEACAAFDSEALGCAYGYPTKPHRAVHLEPGVEIVFCKAFEVA